ncbi:PREDICTED: uncharacterized protein LOC107187344 [Dufourea novaeangliae]|uniref:Uncharacterized protein n=1 Tax=Dufourea novaeangliae TaxID=178035 RepID=A0A154NZ88_DUFNO|nr:PREDICTED: uncharacterized protein LOC107187344 [Dufourea novaeangliae]KZC04180.1 hypothetical protein WN55_02069 [Dufourea novaeangliae]
MPGTPMKDENDALEKLQTREHPPNANCEPVVREITQTDRLNKKLLVSLLQRMNKSNDEFDKFMEKGSVDRNSQDDSEF